MWSSDHGRVYQNWKAKWAASGEPVSLCRSKRQVIECCICRAYYEGWPILEDANANLATIPGCIKTGGELVGVERWYVITKLCGVNFVHGNTRPNQQNQKLNRRQTIMISMADSKWSEWKKELLGSKSKSCQPEERIKKWKEQYIYI